MTEVKSKGTKKVGATKPYKHDPDQVMAEIQASNGNRPHKKVKFRHKRGGNIARPPGHPLRRRDKDKPKRQKKFLEAYKIEGTLSGAARRAGVGKTAHTEWLKTDPEYVEMFKEAYDEVVDAGEHELRRRGIHGFRERQERVDREGNVSTVVTEKYSDACLIFYMKGRRRDVFGDKSEVSGPGGGPVEMTIVDRLNAGRQRVAEARRLESNNVIEGEVIDGEGSS